MSRRQTELTQNELHFDPDPQIALAVEVCAELGSNLCWWLLRNIALPTGLAAPTKQHPNGKPVSGATLSRYLSAVHKYPVPCYAKAASLAAKTREGGRSALTERTIDNCLAALRKPLGPNEYGADPYEPVLRETAMLRSGITCKYIMWQYLPAYLLPDERTYYDKKRSLASRAKRELGSPVNCSTKEPSSLVTGELRSSATLETGELGSLKSGSHSGKRNPTLSPGEREKLICAVAQAGVHNATAAVDTALANGNSPASILDRAKHQREKQLYETLCNMLPPPPVAIAAVAAETKDARRTRIVQQHRQAGAKPADINRALVAAGLEPIAVLD